VSAPRDEAPSAMAQAAMRLDELGRWIKRRADRRPTVSSLSMLDGYVAAIVAGPVSIDPLDWICPLLAIDADAFNHGGTPEFAAISAVALRHNVISDTLATAPKRFKPIYRLKPGGGVDVRPWCQGFYVAMKLRLLAWSPLLNRSDIRHGLLLPILAFCADDTGRPVIAMSESVPVTRLLRDAHTDIPIAIDGIRQYWMAGRHRREP
jgi:uncharacterized protein